MNRRTFEVGQAYYQFGNKAAPWLGERARTPVIDTWVYAGLFPFGGYGETSEPDQEFHVFQPYVSFENVLERDPEHGLKIPTLEAALMSCLTFEELVDELKDTRIEGKNSTATPDGGT